MEKNVFKLSQISISICDGVHNTIIDDPDGECYLLSAKNVKNGLINYDDTDRRIDLDTRKKLTKRTKLSPGDVVITTIGTLGEGAVIKEDCSKYEFQRSVGIIKVNNTIANPHYVYYLLTSQPYNDYFHMVATGAAQPCIFLKLLRNLKVELPKKDIQDKIALVLTKYDALIENNNKRIKILEDVAESLYKEWFVRFRYPGFRKDRTKLQSARGWIFGKTENGQIIPESWNFMELKKIGSFKRGKNITAANMNEGMIPVVSAGIDPSGYHDKQNVIGNSLTISASGANAGYLSYHLEDIWAADCSFYNGSNVWFVYSALNFLRPVLNNLQIGSAQPHVYPKNINRISTIVPPSHLIKLFNEKVAPYFEKIKELQAQNKNLKLQRNLLLARLVTGKLSIEGKEIL